MIIRFSQSRLSNEGHFQHKTDIKDLLERYPETGKRLGRLMDDFLAQYKYEDQALEYIARSDYTKKITDANSERKNTVTGLFEHIDADTRHFNAERKQEAISLQNVKSTYRDMTRKGVNEMTAAMHNFLQEMNSRHAMLHNLNLCEWVDHLTGLNGDVTALVKERDRERASQMIPSMSDIRPKIDKATEAIYEALSTFANISPDDAELAGCIGELNAINKRNADAVAQHEGHLAAAAEKKKKAAGSPNPDPEE
jgi:hypothetical protein